MIQPTTTNTSTNGTGNDHAVATFVYGWVDSPNGRGTLDIIQTCIATVFLCTYTALFLNIRPDCGTRMSYVLHKTKWVVFTLFCPELTTGIAAEQWRTSRQSVEDFTGLRERLEQSEKAAPQGLLGNVNETLRQLRLQPWTARHAFFADMGGVLLKCPDFKEFPVNSYQFFWLVENRHMAYPGLRERTIMDKNKADLFARAITLFQITWFTVQSIARGVQHLGITTLELSTLAFAFCTLHAFWFWQGKPFDVEEPVTLVCEKPLRAILEEAAPNIRPGWRYMTTPLDFLDPGSRLSYVEPFFWGVRVVFAREGKAPPILPVPSFTNVATIPPRGLKPHDIVFASFFAPLYFAIHLAAWDFPFPTRIEHNLWRASAIILAGTVALYMIGCWPSCSISEYFFPGRPIHAIDRAKILPPWGLRLIMVPVIVLYFAARMYIIVEGFVSLRRLPATAFETVNWWNFVPHA